MSTRGISDMFFVSPPSGACPVAWAPRRCIRGDSRPTALPPRRCIRGDSRPTTSAMHPRRQRRMNSSGLRPRPSLIRKVFSEDATDRRAEEAATGGTRSADHHCTAASRRHLPLHAHTHTLAYTSLRKDGDPNVWNAISKSVLPTDYL